MSDDSFRDLFERKGFNYPGRSGVGDGWLELVDNLLDELITLNWFDDPNRRIMQVKEKFGGLRFYVYGATDEMRKLIDQFEMKSSSICETCGQPGVPRSGGWIVTLCDICGKNRPEWDANY